MAWNGAGPGGHAMPVPGFGAQPPVSMGPPPNNFGFQQQAGFGAPFAFAPGTASAFDFSASFAAPTPGSVPAQSFAPKNFGFGFGGPVGAGQNAFGAGLDTSAFQGFGGPSPSLFDVAQGPVQTSPAQGPLNTPKKDLFGDLSIDDIKRGYVPPIQPAPVAAHAAVTPSKESSKPVQMSAPASAAPAHTSTHVASNQVNSSFSAPLAVEPAPPSHVMTNPTPQVATAPNLFQEADPTPTSKPAEAAPKKADDFLSHMELSAPTKAPTLTEISQPSTKPTTFTNESLVKSKVDWDKARVLMEAYLTPVKTEPAPAAEPQQKTTQASPGTGDDWSGFDTTATSEGEGDWSSFGSAPALPATSLPPQPEPATTQLPQMETRHEPVTNTMPAPQAAPQIQSTPAPSSQAADWASFMATATQTTQHASENVFGFDSSAFDTSAFNFSSTSAFSAPVADTVPTPSVEHAPMEAPTPIQEAIVSAAPEMATEIAIIPQTPSSSVTPLQKSPSGDKFADFTSNTTHEDWSDFPETESVPATPQKQIPEPVTPAGDAVKNTPSKRSDTKVFDLNSFTLPVAPTHPKPEESHQDSSVSLSDLHALNGPLPSQEQPKVDLFDSLGSTAPANQTPSAAMDLLSLASPAPLTNAFATFASTPQPLNESNGSAFSDASGVPAWMQSNKSQDSELPSPQPLAALPLTPAATSTAPISLDSLKRQFLEIMAADMAAPFLWIFENASKQITLTPSERQTLAESLIEDCKSKKVISVSAARMNAWHSLLTKVVEDFSKAATYLSTASMQAEMHSEAILVAYFANPKTQAYLSALARVAAVAKRIGAAIQSNANTPTLNHTPRTLSRYFKPSVLKALQALASSVETSWSSVVARIEEMEEQCGDDLAAPRPSSLLKDVPLPVPHAPANFTCYLCYRGFDEHEGPSQHNGQNFHATCSNYWTHRVSASPPPL